MIRISTLALLVLASTGSVKAVIRTLRAADSGRHVIRAHNEGVVPRQSTLEIDSIVLTTPLRKCATGRLCLIWKASP